MRRRPLGDTDNAPPAAGKRGPFVKFKWPRRKPKDEVGILWDQFRDRTGD